MKILKKYEFRTNSDSSCDCVFVKLESDKRTELHFPVLYPCCERHVRFEFMSVVRGYGVDMFCQVSAPRVAKMMCVLANAVSLVVDR